MIIVLMSYGFLHGLCAGVVLTRGGIRTASAMARIVMALVAPLLVLGGLADGAIERARRRP